MLVEIWCARCHHEHAEHDLKSNRECPAPNGGKFEGESITVVIF